MTYPISNATPATGWFNNQQACDQHMNALNHFACECRVCDETWPTEQERINHETDEHYYCDDCDRWFQNANNARMVTHSLTGDAPCEILTT